MVNWYLTFTLNSFYSTFLYHRRKKVKNLFPGSLPTEVLKATGWGSECVNQTYMYEIWKGKEEQQWSIRHCSVGFPLSKMSVSVEVFWNNIPASTYWSLFLEGGCWDSGHMLNLIFRHNVSLNPSSWDLCSQLLEFSSWQMGLLKKIYQRIIRILEGLSAKIQNWKQREKSNSSHHFGLKPFDIPEKNNHEFKLYFWWHQDIKSTTTKTRDHQKRRQWWTTPTLSGGHEEIH